MNTTVNFSLTDKMAIARSITDRASGERGTYEIERQMGAYLLYIEFAYDFDAHAEIGGTYPGYPSEQIGVLDREYYDVWRFECLDADGEPVETNLSATALNELIN